MIAGEMLRDNFKCKRVGVVGGPVKDARSNGRIKGFLEIFPNAVVLSAGTWGRPIPRRLFTDVAEAALEGRTTGTPAVRANQAFVPSESEDLDGGNSK